MYLNSKKINTKLFLWSLFFVQLFLISVFLLFSSIYNNNDFISDNRNSVKFIDKLVIKGNNSKLVSNHYSIKNVFGGGSNALPPGISNNFVVSNTTYNHSKTFYKLNERIICFREGTLISNTTTATKCNCLQEWHGADCGQPEVIWRAFMTSKIPIASAPLLHPHKIFYIIQTSGFSIETLEIQIMELKDVVDFFIICDQLLMTHLNLNHLTKDDFIQTHFTSTFVKKYLQMGKILLIQDDLCTSKSIYKKMLDKVSGIEGTDVLLYSRANVIFNRKSINYLKWYTNWPQPIKFRLKYNYYGFFWQHPANTIISGAACQLNTLNEMFKSDPDELEEDGNLPPSILPSNMIVGDLNHYGGWYCQYCAQPNDIIKILELDNQLSLSSTTGTLSNNYTNTKHINLDYIQKQISEGLYNLTEDTKHKLIKLYRSNDKYYVPDYVKNNSWKFDNIVINLFAKWDDNDDEY